LARLHQLGHADAVSYFFEHHRTDQTHRFGLVQSQAPCEALLGQGADLVQL